jgi:two-component system, NarL family, response regulator NreC
MENKIRVMLVDDHDVVRAGFKSLLETFPEIEVIAEAADGQQALDRAAETDPDVILMDISMPVMDGLEATRQIRQQLPHCKVVALTVHEDKQFLVEILGAGANGYITKRAPAEEVITAIRSVAAAENNVYLCPRVAHYLVQGYLELASDAGPHTPQTNPEDFERLGLLSDRELEVLTNVADGLTSHQVGDKLGISHNTVSRHRDRIMSKLDVHSHSDLVRFAIRTGLIGL